MRLLIPETLKALRLRHHVTLTEVAKALGVTKSAAGRIESSHTNLTAESIGRQLEVIGSNVAEFCQELAHQHGETIALAQDEIDTFTRAFIAAFREYRKL